MKITKLLGVSVSSLAMLASVNAAYAASAELIAAAKAEGQLTVIALPHDWCGYGATIDKFKALYPEIQVNELNPDAGSADEIEAIRANMGNMGPQAPDVVDVGLAFGPSGKAEGLFQPYMVDHMDQFSVADSEGYWYGGYYGVMAFEVNTDLVTNVPQDWSDLLKPEYANSVALAGDPRSSAQAILGVYAAGLSASGGNAMDAPMAGLDFFKKLNDAGNFVPVIGKAASIAQGTTPIVIRWDYNALADRATLNGNPPIEVVVPKTGVLAGVYAQAVSAYAPHPNAGKLWLDFIYSDEGQLSFLEGYCHPARFNALSADSMIPQAVLDALPPADAYKIAVFPSLDELDANKTTVTGSWDSVVGANVQ
ncbi:MAG: ABC transporter substrate-binding protein [Hyphomicrobiaceae bacterium]|nr:ABC transporter substrate-binding protein [Hyphomicrobiaceae bacterium]